MMQTGQILLHPNRLTMTDLIPTAIPLILATTLLSAVGLGTVLGSNLIRPELGLWPASPETAPIRHHTAFGLFRLFCGGTVFFALFSALNAGWGHWAQYVLGLPLMLIAFAITLRGYAFLGIDNTYCESDGLVTGGMYQYSRNPQYVTSVLATIGLGITAGSWITIGLALILFALYFLFVLNEERWLIRG